MNDPVFPILAWEFFLTVGGATALLTAAWRSSAVEASTGAPALIPRWIALVLFGSTLVGALLNRIATRDWVHLQWSLGLPLLGLFCVSGAFSSAWSSNDTRDRGWSGWWFPIAALSIGLAAIVLQFAAPGVVPAHRNSPGPLIGAFEIAAYGLGLGELPSAVTLEHSASEGRAVGHLSRDLTVAISVLTLAAQLVIAYVALAFASRSMPEGRLRRVFALLAPTLLTAAMLPIWWSSAYGLWSMNVFYLHAFGPTLLAATLAVLALAAAQAGGRAKIASATPSSQ